MLWVTWAQAVRLEIMDPMVKLATPATKGPQGIMVLAVRWEPKVQLVTKEIEEQMEWTTYLPAMPQRQELQKPPQPIEVNQRLSDEALQHIYEEVVKHRTHLFGLMLNECVQ